MIPGLPGWHARVLPSPKVNSAVDPRNPKPPLARRRGLLTCGALIAATLILAGCGSTSDADQATETEKAEQLVAATQAAGVAPHLTTDLAEALYGTDASTVCDVFESGLTTAERNDLLGNPSGRRSKTITTNAVEYGRIVVQTYCPDELANYDEVVC